MDSFRFPIGASRLCAGKGRLRLWLIIERGLSAAGCVEIFAEYAPVELVAMCVLIRCWIVAEDEIIPKRGGYDLSFLDQLGDLENASPTAVINNRKPKCSDFNGVGKNFYIFHHLFPSFLFSPFSCLLLRLVSFQAAF